MKKNASGFTLIELLAVIVVLAIVILMASMAIIPRMNEARKQVFAMEANEAINAASSYFMNGEVTGTGASFPVTEGGAKCVSIADLVANGDFKGKDYEGAVRVEKHGNSYLYTISMTNKKLQVNQKGVEGTKTNDSNDNRKSVDITAANVEDYKAPTNDGQGFKLPEGCQITTNP